MSALREVGEAYALRAFLDGWRRGNSAFEEL